MFGDFDASDLGYGGNDSDGSGCLAKFIFIVICVILYVIFVD